MALILRYAVRSDLGLVRSNNEDSVYAGPRLLAIADGMGGHAAGEVASKIVISALEQLDEDRPIPDLMGELRETVHDANAQIASAVAHDAELEGMGTTLTALRFVGSQIGLAHIGDSRAYLLRDGLLSQITHDDTYVQHLVDAGKLTPEQAKDHPRKSVILRALLGTDIEPDVSVRVARAGDRYLLCTDGLSDVVSIDTLLDTLGIPDPQEAADRLVELALRGGGPDNVTVIVADVVNARSGESADEVPVVAGALVDPSAADVPSDSSPAERAANIGRPSRATQEPPVTRRRWTWRVPLLVAIVLAVVAGGLAGAYALTQTYYFVGRDGSQVAVFRGVNTQIGPLKFFNVYKNNTGLVVADLNPSVRSQVHDGISADNEKDAEQIVANLHGQLLPVCLVTSPTSPTSPTPPTPPTTASPTPGTKQSTAATRAHVSRTAGATSPAKTAPGTARSSVPPTPTSSVTPTLPAPTQLPGVTCRPAR